MEDARILKEEQAKARMEAANKKKEEEVCGRGVVCCSVLQCGVVCSVGVFGFFAE